MRTIREVLNAAAYALAKEAGQGIYFDEGYDFSHTDDVNWLRFWRQAVATYEVFFGKLLEEVLDIEFSDFVDLSQENARLRRALGQAADIIESAADAIDVLDEDIDGEGAEARDDAARFRRMSLGEPEASEEDCAPNYDAWCKREERRGFSEEDLRESRDEVASYLDSLTWDGVSRVRALAERVAVEGSVDEAAASLSQFFEDAVRRAREPGCMIEQSLLVVGAEGAGKTTLLSAIVGKDHFGEFEHDGRRSSRVDEMHACWVASVFAHNLADGELRGFLAQTSDTCRFAFAKEATRHERPFLPVVFVHSTGEPGTVRRFLPLRLGTGVREAVAWVKANRDQLWAEAVARYETAAEQGSAATADGGSASPAV